MSWVTVSLIPILAALPEVEELTRTVLEDGRRVTVQVAPPVKDPQPTSRLVDGDVRTSHYAGGQIRWPDGARPTVTLDLHRTRLVTGVHVGYAGAIKLTGTERRHDGRWTPLPAGCVEDHPAKYPATSWLIAEGLALPADALRLKWSLSGGSGQLTEIHLFGQRTEDGRSMAHVATSPRLPVAHRNAEVIFDLRNRDSDQPRTIDVSLRLLDGDGKEVATSPKVSRRVKPLRSETVRVPMRMPDPGRYALKAEIPAAPDTTLSQDVYVTPRELQFIWFGVPNEAQWATTVCNASLPHEVGRWQRRGVAALGWSGGYCYRDKFDEDGFTGYWTDGLKGHPTGIAIDEFGNHDGKPTDLQMANALLRAHRAVPDKTIVVWQAGVSPWEVAASYTVAADWVVFECYMNYFNNRRHHFDVRIKRLREFGLMHKTVLGLCCTSDKIGTTAEGLEQQVRYVRRKAPEMPGLGFYKAYGTGAALVPVADELCFKYFVMPTILTWVDSRIATRVLVRNIGATPARDVDVEFCTGPEATPKVVQSHRIDRLVPDAVAEVRLDPAHAGKQDVFFRVKPSSHYSCVSDPHRLATSSPDKQPG